MQVVEAAGKGPIQPIMPLASINFVHFDRGWSGTMLETRWPDRRARLE